MSLIKKLVEKLNDSTPIDEKCEFILKVYKDSNAFIPNKEEIIIDWLCSAIGQDQGLTTKSKFETTLNSDLMILRKKLGGNSRLKIWETLLIVLEIGELTARTDLTLKNSFVLVLLKQIQNNSIKKGHALTKTVLKCVTVILKTPNAIIFNRQVSLLLQILGATCKVGLQLNLSEEMELKTAIIKMIECLIDPKIIALCLSLHFDDFLEYNLKNAMLIILQCAENDEPLKNSVTNFLKNVTSRKEILPQYEELFIEVDDSIRENKNAAKLLKHLSNIWASRSKILMKAVEASMPIIFDGILSRLKKLKSQPYFEILVVCCRIFGTEKGFPVDEENGSYSVVAMLPMLQICVKYKQSFLLEGLVPRKFQLQWFQLLFKTLLNLHTLGDCSEEFYANLTLLMEISPEIAEPFVDNIWNFTWLSNKKAVSPNQSIFLCQLLESYIEMRQVPKLFSKLFDQLKKNPGVEIKDLNGVVFPVEFNQKLSDCFAALPSGQSVELLGKLINVCEYHYRDVDFEMRLGYCTVVEIFTVFLLHMRLVDSSVPKPIVEEASNLLLKTSEFITTLLNRIRKENSVKLYLTLHLCHAWGEAHSTFKIFRTDYPHSGWPIKEVKLEVFDLSLLHDGSFWGELLDSTTRYNNPLLIMASVSLLVQKVKVLIISGNASTTVGKESLRVVASYIYGDLLENLSFAEDVTQNVGKRMSQVNEQSLPSTLYYLGIEWLPLFLSNLESSRLLAVSSCIIKSLTTENRKETTSTYTITQKFLKSNFFSESKSMQSAFITAIFEKLNTLVNSHKRKYREDEEEPLTTSNVFKLLSKHPQIWEMQTDLFNGAESNCSKNDVKIWTCLTKAGDAFASSEKYSKGVNFNFKEISHSLSMFRYLPLDNLQPANALRCAVGLFHLLILVKKSDSELLSQLFVEAAELLKLLLENKEKHIFQLLDCHTILRNILEISERTNNDYNTVVWTENLLDKLAFLMFNNENVHVKIQRFFESIRESPRKTIHQTHLLQIFLRYITIQKKSSRRNLKKQNVLIFCSEMGEMIASLLNDRLDVFDVETDDVSRRINLRSIQSLVEYYCLGTMDQKAKMVLVKMIPLKELLRVLQSSDCDVLKRVMLQLLKVLCFNREKLEVALPVEFVISAWKVLSKLEVDVSNDSIRKQTLNITLPTKTNSVILTPITTSSPNNSDILSQTITELIKVSNDIELKEICGELEKTCTLIDFKDEIQFEKYTGLVTCLIQASVNKDQVLVQHAFQSILRTCLIWTSQNPAASRSVNILLGFLIKIEHYWIKLIKAISVHQLLQICSMVNLKDCACDMETLTSICQSLLTILNYLLMKHTRQMLVSSPTFVTTLGNVWLTLVRIINQDAYETYEFKQQNTILSCIQWMDKTLSQMVANRKMFSKAILFFIFDFVKEVENITIHPSVKQLVIQTVNLMLKLLENSDTDVLAANLTGGAKEIFQRFYNEYHHYKYRGKV